MAGLVNQQNQGGHGKNRAEKKICIREVNAVLDQRLNRGLLRVGPSEKDKQLNV